MARKRNKTLSLSDGVVEWLEDRENQSQTVEDAVREVYDI